MTNVSLVVVTFMKIDFSVLARRRRYQTAGSDRARPGAAGGTETASIVGAVRELLTDDIAMAAARPIWPAL